MTDIGVVAEELQCIENATGFLTGPFYKQYPVDWYVLQKNAWKLASNFNGQMPEHCVELPMIGMACSPVDAVGCPNGCSPGCDRTKWPREIHVASARGVTAHFGGLMPTDDVPMQSGVTDLWFTFEGDPESYAFASMTKEPGDSDLSFVNWNLDIFSPDGAYILLLQDRLGPYHIVATDKLKDYLAGKRAANYVVTKKSGYDEQERIYQNGHWISTNEVQFTVSCCGSSETLTYRLPQKVEGFYGRKIPLR